MSKSSLLKSNILPVVAILIFSGAQADIYGQSGFYFGNQINFDYKWTVSQKWDDLTGDWNDTLSVSYTISGANGKPAEIITLSHDESPTSTLREVITYNGDKIANTVGYIKYSLSGEYQKAPLYTLTYWYSGDTMLKYEIAIQASTDSDVKFHSETRYRLVNQKTISDSSFTKISGKIEDLIQQGYEIIDTAWVFSGRSEYSYKENSIVTLGYKPDEDSPVGKDSTVMIGDKISEIYDFGITDDGEWVVMSLTKITYGDLVDQIIYQERENESLVNKERVQFFNNTYPFTGTKHISSSHRINRINAFVSEGNGSCVVNLFLNQSSDISIYLTDLKGRKLGNSVRQRVLPGSFSLPLSVSSPGKYLCYIISGQDRTVVPFTKTK